ncbi:hypothetical protein HYPGJ_31620 [Hyphomicrobium sp. GJ21]|nr:hypothetical protein HYPGJ_31620 [Hyphomicrobium sp. GJ21]
MAQLNCAIRLWLNEDDLCSVQTLAWSARTVLRDLLKAKIGIYRDRFGDFGLDRETANFLKHADRDPYSRILEIDPLIPEFVMYDAIRLADDLEIPRSRETKVAMEVICMKHRMGIFTPSRHEEEEEHEERRREESRYEDLSEEEREEHHAWVEHEDKIRHSAWMNIGRLRLADEMPF